MEDMTLIILQHTVGYWYREDYKGTPTEADVEHITKLITEGYIEGELCTMDRDQDTIHYGWWTIRKEHS